ncbi:MAG: hypothetical protein ABR889_02815 [Acidobacteriaceae bacterium]|jgi:tetratricopeptide (TPR) repeat protein
MNRTARIFGFLAGAALLPAMAQPQTAPAPQISSLNARTVLLEAAHWMTVTNLARISVKWWDADPDSIQLTSDGLRFDAKEVRGKHDTHHFFLPLKPADSFEGDCNDNYLFCVLLSKSTRKEIELFDETQKGHYFLIFGATKQVHLLPSSCLDTPQDQKTACLQSAARFAAALNVIVGSQTHLYSAEEFSKQAAAWRALAVKPPLPEDVHIQQMLAEDAIKSNKPEDALRYYEQGLNLDWTWPDGWFNAAIVAGELGHYANAAGYMKNYLELVPDAADAQAARDKMLVWKAKASEGQ